MRKTTSLIFLIAFVGSIANADNFSTFFDKNIRTETLLAVECHKIKSNRSALGSAFLR